MSRTAFVKAQYPRFSNNSNNTNTTDYNNMNFNLTQQVEREKDNIKNVLETAENHFEKNIDKYKRKREMGLTGLKKEMELKMRTEIHEIEERKNHHINDLIQNHDKAFKELKQFYNSTTSENLSMIKDQRKQLTKSQANHKTNQKLISQKRAVNSGLRVSQLQ